MCNLNMELLLIFIMVLAVIIIYLWLRGGHKVGGYRSVAITNLFDLPAVMEYVDEITGMTVTHNTKRDRYMRPDSDEQIRTIAKRGAASDYGRLIQLLSKFHRGSTHDIVRLLQRRDSEIYSELRRRFPRDDIDPTRRDRYQAEGIFRHISQYVTRPEVYLDIGCNRGGITRELSQLMTAKRTLGVDVIASEPDGVEYSRITDRLPYKDTSVDVVTANMTLHHVKDVPAMMREIHRVLRPGGHLFIKEHDCWNVMDAMLIDVEHILYNRVGGDDGEYNMHYYTNYSGWDRLAAPLKYVAADYYYPALRNEMTATRAFWAVYKK